VRPTVDQVSANRRKLKTAYYRLFTSPEAEVVLLDLNHQFNRTTLRINSGRIDPYDSIAAAGSREVLLYIDTMLEKESNATTE